MQSAAAASQSARSEEHIDDVDAHSRVQQDVLIQPWSSTDNRSQKSADASPLSAAIQNRRSPSSLQVPAILPLQNNLVSNNSGQDVRNTLSVPSGPLHSSSPVYPRNGQQSVESPVLQNHSQTFYHGSINNFNRPRTNLPVFGTTHHLAAHYGIPTRLPPIPRINFTSTTTNIRPPVPRFDESTPSTSASTSYQQPQAVSDDLGFRQFDTVMADYLKMVKDNSGTAVPSSPAKVPAQLEPPSAEQEGAAVQSISNMLFGEFFGATHYHIEGVTHRDLRGPAGGANDFTSPAWNDTPAWNEYLTSPFVDDETPFESFLDTPAAPNMPDVFQSPAVAGLNLGEEMFDGMPLVTHPNQTGYADGVNDFAKMSLQTAVSQPPPIPATESASASPIKPPVPNFDNMYTISPAMPTLEVPSTQTSPLMNDVSTVDEPVDENTIGRRKKVPTGTRKNITPETLIPFDAPTQARNYSAPSATSRKEIPAVFARKRARSAAFDEEDELAGSDGGSAEAPLNSSEADAIAAKRRQNTLAARRSRRRKLEHQQQLEERVVSAERERDMWKERAMMMRNLLVQGGQPDPFMNMSM